VTKGCGCGDLIRTGENGWIAARATPEALAADLEAILGDRDALTSAGRNAAEHVRSCYSVEAMVSRMALLYREILTDFRAG
ncbi:MAG: glycosyltransferase, partial [Candidatus Omnitrophica bacterium]|nr:glycosyltransferase [Candidatus Omnitrophota bacterium]